MKTKSNSISSAVCHSFGGVVCAGAVLLISTSAQAQNLFMSSDTTIYEFTPGGAYSTFATESGDALGLAFNSTGDLFVPNSDNGTIAEIAPNGTQRTFASRLSYPTALAFNSAGNLFVSDMGASAIYEFTPDGVRSTFATGLYDPYGLAFNSAGDLFADGSSSVYEFTPSGVRSTFASVPGEGLGGLAFNSAGDLFVAAGGTAGYIYEFTSGGVQSTFASGLDEPISLAFNSAGNLFVSDFGSGVYIYEFTQDGMRSAFDSSVGAIGLAFQGETLPVPEPSAMWLLAVGATALLVHRRRNLAGWLRRAGNDPPEPTHGVFSPLCERRLFLIVIEESKTNKK